MAPPSTPVTPPSGRRVRRLPGSATGAVLRAVLRSPSLRRVELAFLLFNATEFGTWVAILLYGYAASGPAAVGLVALSQVLPGAIAAPLLATLADRHRRERVLSLGYLAQAALFGVAAVGMLAGAPAPPVYVVAALATSSLALARPTHGALLPDLSRTPEELAAANALSGSAEGLGMLLGPLVAAVLLVEGTPGTVFAAGALGVLLAGLLVLGLRRPEVPGPVVDQVADADPAEVPADGADASAAPAAPATAGALHRLATIAGHRDTALVVGLLALRQVVIGALDVLFILLAMEVLRTGESGAGVLNTALGAGTVLGGAAALGLVGRPRVAGALVGAALVFGGCVAVLGLPIPVAVAPAVIVLVGMGSGGTDVAGRTLLQRATPPDLLAGVLGALEGVGLAGLAAGSLLGSAVASWLGAQGALLAAGALMPLAVLVALGALRGIDARVRVPVRELALLRLVPIFRPLPPLPLEAVAARARWVTVEPGESFIREGDHGDRYVVLESGTAHVTRLGELLRVAQGPGDGVGEIALLHDVPRIATITAMTPCVLLVIERRPFLEAVTGHEQAHGIARDVARARMA